MAVEKTPGRIRQMFDHISPTYDLLNHLFSLNQDARWRRATAAECPRNGLILDLCCGTGDQALAIAEACSARIVAADFAGQMLRRAARKTAGHAVRYVQADALALPFPTEMFDAVTVAFGVRNMRDARRGLSEIRRVIKQGGRALILEFAVPRTPLVRQFYLLYMTRVMGAVGDAVSRSRSYRYLSQSVESWHDSVEFRGLLQSCGFRQVRSRPFSLGIAHLTIGTR